MWNFVLAAANAFAASSAAQDQNAARQEAYERQRAQDDQNRKLAKEDASNKFVDMRNAAQKAGFNPLTALRMTGAAGFGAYGGYTAQVPVLSKVNFARSIGTSLVSAYATMKINEPIDKYNREIRELEKQERKLRIEGMLPKMSNKVFNKVKDAIETVPLEMEVSAKNWSQLTKDMQTKITNAENVTAQAKIEGMKDTKAVFRAFGIDFHGSGAFSSAAAIEESLGDNFLVGEAAGLLILGDALLSTASTNLNKNLKTHSITSRTGRQDRTHNYKIHKNDIFLGAVPPLSQKMFTTGGVTTMGYAN